MVSNRSKATTWLALVAALSAWGSTDLSAQTNLTGAWAMEVTTETGTTTPSMTLQQDGNRLTGRYTSPTLGDADVTGTVDGSRFTISFTASLQGQDVPVVYAGTVDAAGVMTGTLDLAGGLASGTFTARKR